MSPLKNPASYLVDSSNTAAILHCRLALLPCVCMGFVNKTLL